MADIRISHAHALPQDAARRAAEQVAEQIARDYDMALEWNGDVLVFARSGVSGALVLEPNLAYVEVRLGILFKAFAPVIEQKLTEKLRRVFG
ncbi:MAG TPA: polyhydroxyalkanoic acid system family protein [Noviherbaspirillum sp.]|jgi:putative polyhydroxyalkanoate system protein|uniref:polyhydroxyalkanoic acid system family protein n=1 Tax=Noviherbaspirillum sp. TaxID=1926288 RepID=UPI002F95B971